MSQDDGSFGQEFLTDAQVAELLNITSRTTLRWRRDGDGPPFVRIGPRCVRYKRSDLDAWIAAQTFPHRAAECSG